MRHPPHRCVRRGTAAARWLPLAGVIFAVASCAAAVNSSTHSVTTAETAGSSSDISPVERLTATVTYQDGQERFDPLPANYEPKIDATQAFAAFARSVDPRSLGTDEKPIIVLASYTNFITGKHETFVTGTMDPVAAAKSDEVSKSWWTDVPVWYIRYLHVPTAPAGVIPAPGRTQGPPKVVIQEMVIPVSAETGQVLMMENVSADRTPTSWPSPADDHGDTGNKSVPGGFPQVTSDQTSTH